MSQSRKYRGYATQSIVAEYLQQHGFPYAASAGAGRKGTDITGTVGLDWEVKARRNINLVGLIRQMTDRTDGVDLRLGVVRPDGVGPSTIGDWPAVLPLSDLVNLLRAVGYGDLQTETEGE